MRRPPPGRWRAGSPTPASRTRVPPAGTPPPDVTVVVPVRDRAGELDRCLAALGGEHPVHRRRRRVAPTRPRSPRSPTGTAPGCVRRDATAARRAARNTGLAAVDHRVRRVPRQRLRRRRAGWLDPLLAHLADPVVAAVAPRIVGTRPDTWAGRYTAARRQPRPRVEARAGSLPGARVAYVPTAALVARRAALLRRRAARRRLRPGAARTARTSTSSGGCTRPGWRVRYDPSVRVAHHEPTRWRELLRAALPLRHVGRAAGRARTPAPSRRWSSTRGRRWPSLALLARRPVLGGRGLRGRRRPRRPRDRCAPPACPTAGTARAVADARPADLARRSGATRTQFAGAAVVAAAVLPGRRRSPAGRASLLLGRPLAAWWPRRAASTRVRFVARPARRRGRLRRRRAGRLPRAHRTTRPAASGRRPPAAAPTPGPTGPTRSDPWPTPGSRPSPRRSAARRSGCRRRCTARWSPAPSAG